MQSTRVCRQALTCRLLRCSVYDVTEFLPGPSTNIDREPSTDAAAHTEHPGGKKILLKACGKDSSEAFWQ